MTILKRLSKQRGFAYTNIFMLLFSLIMTSMPVQSVYASSNNSNDTNDYGEIKNESTFKDYKRARIDKRVTWGEKPGEYYIDLTIEGKDATKIDTTDIVLVYDNSNSMATNNRVGIAKAATTNFVQHLLDNYKNTYRIALVSYGSAVLDGRYRSWPRSAGYTDNVSYKTLTNNSNSITSVIPSNIPSNRKKPMDGGTFTQQGLEEAGKILERSSADNKVIITITDGVTTFSYDQNRKVIGQGTSYRAEYGRNTVSERDLLVAKGYDLYTIGVEISAEQGITLRQAEQLMRDISSRPENAYFVRSVSDLQTNLMDIATRLNQSILGGVVEDPMGEMFELQGADNFTRASNEKLTDGSYYLSASNPKLLEGVSVVTEGQKIKVSNLNLGEGERINLRYKVQIDTENSEFEADKVYRTNGETTLTPVASRPEEKNKFPEPWASAKGMKISGTKIWEDYGLDHHRPKDIQLTLKPKDESIKVKPITVTVTPNQNGDWVYEFPNQVIYDSKGNKIEYTIVEEPVEGYEAYTEPEAEGKINLTNKLILEPAITLTKTADRDDLKVNEKIKYSFMIKNTGNVPLDSITLTDELDGLSQINYLSLNGEKLDSSENLLLNPGDELQAEADYTIKQSDIDQGQVINKAKVTGQSTTPDKTKVTDKDQAKVPQELKPNLSLEKTSNKNKVNQVDEEITYTFKVKNTGNVTLFDLVLTDEKLGGEIQLEKEKLYPGETTLASASYKVTQEDLNKGEILNKAVVEANPPNYDSNDPSAQKTKAKDENKVLAEQKPSINLKKTSDKEDLVLNETITYTFEITNTGNVDLSDIKLTDELKGLSDISYLTHNNQTISDLKNLVLKPKDKVLAQATYKINQSDVDQGQLINDANVTGKSPEQVEVKDEDLVPVPANVKPAISLEKTSDKKEVKQVGEEIEYTFTVKNTGNVTLNDVTVSDPMLEKLGLDVKLSDTRLAPGQTTKGQASYKVTQADLDRGEIINKASVTGTPPNPEDSKPKDSDEITVLTDQVAKIELEKTSDLDKVTELGQEITYTFVVKNTGNVTLTDVIVKDDKISNEIKLEKTTLAPGESSKATAIYITTQADINAKEIINTALAEGTPPNFDPEDPDANTKPNAEDDDVVPTEQTPGISLNKETSAKELVAGEEIEYIFTVENTGNVTLSNVKITDVLEGISQIDYLTINNTPLSREGFSSYSNFANNKVNLFAKEEMKTPLTAQSKDLLPTNITLNPGDVLRAKATYTVTQADVDKGLVENTATVVGKTPSEKTVEDEDTKKVTQSHTPGLSLEKTSDVEEVVNVGDEITYTFTVKNTGNVTLNDVTVSDPMLEKLGLDVTLSDTRLAPGQTTKGQASYTVTQADLDRGEIVNKASVTGTPPNPDDPKPEAPSTNKVPAKQRPAIELVKEADRTDLVAGEKLAYSFTATNTGNVTLHEVSISDLLEGLSEITYVSVNGQELTDKEVSLKPGDVLVAEASYEISQADVDAGEVLNEAEVTGKTAQDEKVSDQDQVTVPQEHTPGLSLEKTSDVEEVVNVGDEITYTFTVKNTGNVTLNDVTVSDPMLEKLGLDVTLSDTRLAPGQTTKGQASYTVTQADLDRGEIVNKASVTGTPPNPDDPKPEAPSTNKVPAKQTPAIELVKEADRTDLVAGEKLAYSFTATNTGNVTLHEVSISDLLEGLSEITYVSVNGQELTDKEVSLKPGDVLVAEASYEISQADVDAGEVLNEAEVTGKTAQDEKVSDQDQVTVPQEHTPGLSLEKTSDVEEVVNVGDEITYTFTVKNTGNVTLNDVTVSDPMLEKLGLDVTLSDTRLAPGQTTKGQASYTVTQADLDRGEIVNKASVTGTPPNPDDPKPEDPSTNKVLVKQNPKLVLEKTSDVDMIEKVGDEIVYNFVITNKGNTTIKQLVLNDPMLGGQIKLPTAELKPGESVRTQVVYKVTQSDLTKEKIVNKAEVSGETETKILIQAHDKDELEVNKVTLESPNTPIKPDKPNKSPNDSDKASQSDEREKHGPENKQGLSLPKTATDIFNSLAVGLAILLVGLGLRMISARRKEI